MADKTELMAYLAAVKENIGRQHDEGWAWCAQVIDAAITEINRPAPENKPLTNFQRITENPEKLAKVIAATVHGYWAGVTITDDPAKWLEWLNHPDGGGENGKT